MDQGTAPGARLDSRGKNKHLRREITLHFNHCFPISDLYTKTWFMLKILKFLFNLHADPSSISFHSCSLVVIMHLLHKKHNKRQHIKSVSGLAYL